MTDDGTTNGTATPGTPELSTLSLTEYAANPTPPGEKHDLPPDWDVPKSFLLPNGYPDVRIRALTFCPIIQLLTLL
jgi:threonine dehydratase